MVTSTTSQLSGVTLVALLDELEKIAEAQNPTNKEKAIRWIKGTAQIAAGAGMGAALTTIANKYIDRKAIPLLRSLDPSVQRMIIAPLAAVAAIGTAVAAQKLMEERNRSINKQHE